MKPSETRPLVAKTRGDVVEMIHRGTYVVVDTDGKVVHAHGDPDMSSYLRSSAKPFQLTPTIERGGHTAYGLTQRELSVMSASHSGEPVHLDTVRSILHKADIPETALKCGPHLPGDEQSARVLIRRRMVAQTIHSNCSGKHTGMLVGAKVAGEPLDTYLEYDHPLQQQILRTVSEMADTPLADIAVSRDGCGAPIFAIPVKRIALLFARLGSPDGLESGRAAALTTIRDAIMAAPYLMSGKGRIEVALMEGAPGKIVLKSGALGVFGMGLPELGLGIGLKIEDGDGVTRNAAVIQSLRSVAEDHLGSEFLDGLWKRYCPAIYNLRGELVGETKWIGD
ncbi:asparaginase [Candidatus Poribacteria bacterium]|nr:asparaginase [Candidatus Poribacteria bacterium]